MLKTLQEKKIKNKMTIQDLYASDDFIAGLKMGKEFPKKAVYKIIEKCNEPITIGADSWMYIEKQTIFVIHEIHIKGKYIRTDTIKIPKRLLF